MSSALKLDVQRARTAFQGLNSGYIFADNARESQVLKSVAEAVLVRSNGTSHPTFRCAVPSVSPDAEAAAVLFNASAAEEIAFGTSSTQLLSSLAQAMAHLVHAGDEIVVTGEHEANVDPWKHVAAIHTPPLSLHTWKPISISSRNPYALSYNAAFPALSALLTVRTRIVALSGCSNILGELLNVKEAVHIIRARSPSALIIADLAAFAPHRHIDVRAWDVDFAVISFHKIYGPHLATLYARHAALGAFIGHDKILPVTTTPDGLQLEDLSNKEIYSASMILSYLTGLSTVGTLTTRDSQRMALERTSKMFEEHESTLVEILLNFLTSDSARARGVRVVGPEDSGAARVPTVCFVILNGDKGECALRSCDVVKRVDALGMIRIRSMHFNPHTVMTAVPNARGDDSVVRVSLVHYNTVEEVECIVRALHVILFD